MLMNLTPLKKYRDFRLLFIGQWISIFGNMLTYVAFPYQIYHLTNSSLAVGNIGLVQLFPLLFTSLWGGALADKVNRRKLLLFAEFGLFLISLLLLLNTLYEPRVWVLYLLAGMTSALTGFHRPTLEAIVQSLVQHEDMPAVSALNSFKYAVSMIAGPAIAGIILAKFGLGLIYFIDSITFIVSFFAIYFIRTSLAIPAKAEEPIFQSIREGLRYAVSRQELLGSYAVDFVAMIFGMPMALFPAIAETFQTQLAIGWLYAAPSFGLIITALTSGWVGKVKRYGKAISLSATVWGIAIVAFGLTQNLVFAVMFMAVAGAADNISGMFRQTLWNQTIPQHYRGRLAGIEMISYMSGPLLGNAEAGLIAAGFGTTVSVVSGGILCVVAVILLALLLPKFWSYYAKQPVSV